MGKRVEWQAPIGDDGALMSYPGWIHTSRTDRGRWVSRDTEWTLSLTFDSFDKGIQSAYRFIGIDDQGRRWPMSIARYIEMAKQLVIDHCKVSGRFGVVKQGQNFSLKYLGES